VRFQGREHVLALINLSGGGAMVEGDLGAGLWDTVELVLGDHGEVECAVRWIRANRFGLEFAHETRLDCDRPTRDRMLREVIRKSFPELDGIDGGGGAEAASDEPPAEQNRGETRHPLIWNAIVHHEYEWDNARLRNISSSGAMIECATRLPEGATIYLDLSEAGRIAATVCWSRGDQAGLRFDEKFDMRRLAKSRPAIAPERWVRPDYLRDEKEDTSPWAARWQRLTLEELGRTLAG
ncbi:MAG TPA: PilZ domain-containing protein, partial [Sphingomicrobium sp.]|nr:PilZ domain-containing protein [Sphingomicrobium sp.]